MASKQIQKKRTELTFNEGYYVANECVRICSDCVLCMYWCTYSGLKEVLE